MRVRNRRPPIGISPSRRGITLIEVLVVFGAIGLLTAILVPAVHRSRAAARRIQCASNLHQIGAAFHGFVESNGRMPNTYYSLLELLPQVEQAALYKKLKAGGPIAEFPPGPPLYVCPDDRRADPNWRLTSYCINDGNKLGLPNGIRNILTGEKVLKDIEDGLSTTALFSERLIGTVYPLGLIDKLPPTDDDARREPLRYQWHIPQTFAVGEEAAFTSTCLDPANRVSILPLVPEEGGPMLPFQERRYHHLVPPNHPGCHDGMSGDVTPDFTIYSPTSLHSNGVNVLMADGNVQFIAETIDLNVWRALGSADGGEPVPQF